jgi:hypothetical protein
MRDTNAIFTMAFYFRPIPQAWTHVHLDVEVVR